MKFIITESKFRNFAIKHVIDKLNSLDLSEPEEDENDGFRVNYGILAAGAFRYDYESKILEVDEKILNICDTFKGVEGFGEKTQYKILRTWFELKYDVEVKQVWKWVD